jgi:hypothetical protein
MYSVRIAKNNNLFGICSAVETGNAFEGVLKKEMVFIGFFWYRLLSAGI